MLGETGVPFDLNQKAAFSTKDFQWQERMLDGICSAIGEAGLSNFKCVCIYLCFSQARARAERCTSFADPALPRPPACSLWNYNALNNDEWGDSWNGENFSWFSQSDVTPEALKAAEDGGEAARLNVGARALDAVQVRLSRSPSLTSPCACSYARADDASRSQRPYACKTAGIPLRTSFDLHTRRFHLSYLNPIPPSHPFAAAVPAVAQQDAEPDAPPLVGAECRARETEVFLPARRYGEAARSGRLRVQLRDGDGEWRYDEEVRLFHFSRLFSRRTRLGARALTSPSLPSLTLSSLALALAPATAPDALHPPHEHDARLRPLAHRHRPRALGPPLAARVVRAARGAP